MMMDIGKDLQNAYEEGYKQGRYDEKVETEMSLPKWIPVSERLPNVGEDVLMSIHDMYVAEGCMRDDGDWWQFRWSAIQPKEYITAWQPLPEPYKGGDTE